MPIEQVKPGEVEGVPDISSSIKSVADKSLLEKNSNILTDPAASLVPNKGVNDEPLVVSSDKEVLEFLETLYAVPVERKEFPLSYRERFSNFESNKAEDYSHRKYFSKYHLRIGDCCFYIPPEKFNVKESSETQRESSVRSTSTIKKKFGYSTTDISFTIYFNGAEQINGFEVASPISGVNYYIDGLRSFLAQCKVAPIVPVENHFLNGVCGIYCIAIQAVQVNNIQGFPHLFAVTINAIECNHTAYTIAPSFEFSNMIDWDLFRYYYQRLLVDNIKSITVADSYKFKPIRAANDTDRFIIEIPSDKRLFESNLDEITVFDVKKAKYTTVLDSKKDNFSVQGVSFGFENIITTAKLSNYSKPTVQYLGSGDTFITVQMTTTSETVAKEFKALINKTQFILKKLKSVAGIGFIRVKNSYLEMLGANHLLVDSVTIDTMPSFPGVYIVNLECTNHDILAFSKEEISGYRPFDANRKGTKADCISQSKIGLYNKIAQDVDAEYKMAVTNLYPDLMLPTFTEINKMIPLINKRRDEIGKKRLPFEVYPSSAVTSTYAGGIYSGVLYLDPDFYFMYPYINFNKFPKESEPQVEASEERVVRKSSKQDVANRGIVSSIGEMLNSFSSMLSELKKSTSSIWNDTITKEDIYVGAIEDWSKDRPEPFVNSKEQFNQKTTLTVNGKEILKGMRDSKSPYSPTRIKELESKMIEEKKITRESVDVPEEPTPPSTDDKKPVEEEKVYVDTLTREDLDDFLPVAPCIVEREYHNSSAFQITGSSNGSENGSDFDEPLVEGGTPGGGDGMNGSEATSCSKLGIDATGATRKYLDILLSKVGHGYVWAAKGQVLNEQTEASLRKMCSGHPFRKDLWWGKQVFDCSGFVAYGLYWVDMKDSNGNTIRQYEDGNKDVVRTNCNGLMGYGTGVSQSQLKPGDLCIKSSHIGVYIGNGQIVHASNSAKGVRLGPLKGQNFNCFRRVNWKSELAKTYANYTGYSSSGGGSSTGSSGGGGGNSQEKLSLTYAPTVGKDDGSSVTNPVPPNVQNPGQPVKKEIKIGKCSNEEYNKFDSLIQKYSKKNGLPPNYIKALMYAESTFRPNIGPNSARAVGLLQVTPPPCGDLGYDYNVQKLKEPEYNIMVATEYLNKVCVKVLEKKTGKPAVPLHVCGSYNCGPYGFSSKYNSSGELDVSRLPNETQNHMKRIANFHATLIADGGEDLSYDPNYTGEYESGTGGGEGDGTITNPDSQNFASGFHVIDEKVNKKHGNIVTPIDGTGIGGATTKSVTKYNRYGQPLISISPVNFVVGKEESELLNIKDIAESGLVSFASGSTNSFFASLSGKKASYIFKAPKYSDSFLSQSNKDKEQFNKESIFREQVEEYVVKTLTDVLKKFDLYKPEHDRYIKELARDNLYSAMVDGSRNKIDIALRHIVRKISVIEDIFFDTVNEMCTYLFDFANNFKVDDENNSTETLSSNWIRTTEESVLEEYGGGSCPMFSQLFYQKMNFLSFTNLVRENISGKTIEEKANGLSVNRALPESFEVSCANEAKSTVEGLAFGSDALKLTQGNNAFSSAVNIIKYAIDYMADNGAFDHDVSVDIPNNEELTNIEGNFTKNYSSDKFYAAAIAGLKDPKDSMSVIGSLVDECRYGSKGTMLKAFPTYYFSIVQDNSTWFDGKKLWTNHYPYKSVVGITLTHETDQPVGTANIQVTNLSQNLTRYGKRDRIASDLKNDREYSQINRWLYKRFGYIVGTPKITSNLVDSHNELAEEMKLMTGARVHIRMGYGSDPLKLNVLFNGTIAEINTGEIVDIVAQSDGAELINTVVSSKDGEKNGVMKFQSEPSNCITSTLIDRLSWTFEVSKAWGESSEFNIEHFGLFLGHNQPHNRGREYDLCKNIYLGVYKKATFCEYFRTFKIADGEENVNMFLYNKTPWDVINVVTKILPEFIAAPHYHQFESRLFYGLPCWNYKYRYDVDAASGLIIEEAKTFSQSHLIGADEIIDNRVKVTSKFLHTNAICVFTQGSSTKSSPVTMADKSVDWSLQKTRVVDTTIVQDYFGSDAFYNMIGLARNGETNATNAAVSSILDSYAKTYYDEIICIGNPGIKPHDHIFINDNYGDVYGMATVRSVTHSFSASTGFTTSITPNLITYSKVQDSGMSNYYRSLVHLFDATSIVLDSISTTVQAVENLAKGMSYQEAKLLQYTRSGVIEAKILYEDEKYWENFKVLVEKDTGRDVYIKRLLNQEYIGIYGKTSIEKHLTRELLRNPLTKPLGYFFAMDNTIGLRPLLHKQKPFVAGTKGSTCLIDGWHGSGYYDTLEE